MLPIGIVGRNDMATSSPTNRCNMVVDVMYHFVQIQDLGKDNLLPAERQQLPRELRRPGSRLS